MGENSGYWLLAIGGGFLAGSILFSRWIPRFFLGKDVTELSDDRNPGASNVFIHCGPLWGMLCLLLDVLKGFLPVYLAVRYLDTESLWFGLAMAAPVLGHGIAPFHHFHGGKCISTAFGCLLALLPVSPIVLVLAVLYILFSTVLKISPNRLRSIAAFGLFGLISLAVLAHEQQYSLAVGCTLISLTAIWKHSRHAMEQTCKAVP